MTTKKNRLAPEKIKYRTAQEFPVKHLKRPAIAP
jgi:hypothetical protein